MGRYFVELALVFSLVGGFGNSALIAQEETIASAPPQATSILAEGGAPQETGHGDSDASTWLQRAQQAATSMRPEYLNEKQIVLSYISEAMAENDQTSQATDLAISFNGPSRITALLNIASVRASAQDVSDVDEILALASREIESMRRKDPQEYGYTAANALRQIVGVQCTIGHLERAVESAKSISAEIDKGTTAFTEAGVTTTPPRNIQSHAFWDIAVNQARLGHFKDARVTIRSIPVHVVQDAALWTIVASLAEADKIDEAINLAENLQVTLAPGRKIVVHAGAGGPREIPFSVFAGQAYVAIAEAHERAGDDSSVGETVSGIHSSEVRSHALPRIASLYAERGRFADAKRHASGIPSLSARKFAYWKIAMQQAKQGEFAAAQATVEIEDPMPKALVYCCIAAKQLEAGQASDAAEMFEKAQSTVMSSSHSSRIRILYEIGEILGSHSRREESRRYFQNALEQCQELGEDQIQQTTLVKIAESQYRCGDLEGSKSTLANVTEAHMRIETLRKIAIREHRSGLRDLSLKTFREAVNVAIAIDIPLGMQDPRSEVGALRSIAKSMAQLNEFEAIAEIAGETTHSHAATYLYLGAADWLIELNK